MIKDDDFDWQEYYDTHPEYQKDVEIIMDPKEMYNYVEKPLFIKIEEKLQPFTKKIKNKLTPNKHKK